MNAELAAELEGIVGAEGLCVDPEEVERRTRNTLGLRREILAIVHPRTAEQVREIVLAANRHRFPLYPYSTARNIGYGERLPVTANNVIVDLGRMNRILHVDPELGYADVQPGVTQGQLGEYLHEHGLPFFTDVTGAGRDSSIIGNALDGGVGTTPRGNKRREISCVVGVYGNGETFDTGDFPGLGPDLAGMFVQSNFAIITQFRIQLNRVVDAYRSFTVTLREESDLAPLIDALRELRQRGTLTNQVVITNALDALGASRIRVPEAYAGKPLTNADAQEILSGPLASFGAISAVGAVYGSQAEVRAKQRAVRRVVRARLGRRAAVRFLGDRTLSLLSQVLCSGPCSRLRATAKLAELVTALQAVHGMMRGVASDDAVIGLLGGVRETYGDVGLMWYSSRVPSRAADVARFVDVASSCYRRHGLEYPLEMLLVTPNDIVAIQKIDWPKGNGEQEATAWLLYDTLSSELRKAGFLPYRLGVQSQATACFPEERWRTLRRLKRIFDPNGVIAPGRYGIEAAAD